MTLLISQDDAVVSNSDALSDAPAVRITGARVRFTNSGTILSTADSSAAIILEGVDTYLFNAATGIIRSQRYPLSFGDAILGSAGTDTIVNEGRIDGDVDLGGGADSFTQRSTFQLNRALMGAGDDLFTIETPSSAAMFASGGADWDRVVIGSAIHSIVNGTDGFEQLELLSTSLNLTSFGGFQTMLLAAGGSYNFLNSSNPLVDLTLDNGSIIVADRSRFRSVTGSAAIDMVDLNDLAFPNGGVVTGNVSLGGGDDRLAISWTNSGTAPAVQGNMDGGAGTDSLNLTVTGGRSYDLARATGFETLNLGSGSVGDARIQNANGFAKISISGNKAVLEQSSNPNAVLSLGGKANVSIDAASALGMVTAANGSTTLAGYPGIQAADETRSVILANGGAIGGDVILFLGSDQFDSRAGTVAGTVYGLAGDDTILMGAGNNIVDGGYGADHVEGGAGNDNLAGGGGGDWLDGGADNDSLAGGDGNDQLFGGDGTDSLSGGAGNDAIAVAGTGASVSVDGGADADTIALGAFAGAATLTLGAGQDVIALSGYTPGGALVVTDFLAGSSGDRLSWTSFLQSWLTGWNGTGDPFAAGYLSLVQSGADLLVRIDRDGAAGPGGFVTFMTLKNVSAPALTAFNLDGLTPRADIAGTEGDDVIEGTSGNDLIQGLGGSDWLKGNDGDDRLEGGEGSDLLEAGAGSDLLYGGAGNDTLADQSGTPGNEQFYGEDGNDSLFIEWFSGTVARTVLLDGGIGNDLIDFYVPDRFLDQASLIGGDGNDRISAEGGLNVAIDAGTGADRVTLRQGPTNFTVTLGTGADILVFNSDIFYPAPANTVVTDFEAGDAGDRLELLNYCDTVLTNWDQATNPFATGHLRLLQSGADTLVQVDRDGAASAQGFVTLVTLHNVTATALTGFNLSGFPPDGSKPIGQTFIGTDARNTITGTLGDDIIQALGGNDSVSGRAGDDQIEGGDGDDFLNGNQGNDVIHGGIGLDGIAGGLGNDMLHGDDGDDQLSDRDGGNDQLFGGAGYDSLMVDRAGTGPGDTILMDAGAGGAALDFYALDRFVDSVTILGSNDSDVSDNIRITGGGAVTVDAGAGDDFIMVGNLGGAMSVRFGAGADALTLISAPINGGLITIDDFTGGAESDRIDVGSVTGLHRLVQRGADAVLQLDTDGGGPAGYVDYVIVRNVLASDFVLGSGTYYWIPGGAPPIAADDTIQALEGALTFGNTLLLNDSDDGPLAIAMVNGSAANVGQFFTLASGSELRVLADGGWDYRAIGSMFAATPDFGSGASNLYSYDSFTYTLAGGGTATVTVQIRGVDSADILLGTAGDDVLAGGLFDDQYFVGNAGDRVIENANQGFDIVYASTSYALAENSSVEILSAVDWSSSAALSLNGNGSANIVYGNAGANVIDGGGGADVMSGFGGNDVYFADNGADVVIESANQGADTLYASVSYALAQGSHVETLAAIEPASTAAIALAGNGFANTLFGNAGANVLDGGGGADVLNGLGGDDVYFLDNAGDAVGEASGGGYDTIFTSVSYALGAGISAEVLSAVDWTATVALDLTGNALANRLYGNAGANVIVGGDGDDVLWGLGGGDRLIGGLGEDVYWIYALDDGIIETGGNGYDTAYLFSSYTLAADANVEVASTFNWLGFEAINLTGNGIGNTVFGNAGVNTLNGGEGADRLVGFGGADTFAFTTALGAGNVDTVSDFVAGTDRIALDDAIFTAIGGSLSAGAFVIGTGAADADDRIVYDSATGALFYDADGNGAIAAVQFATLGTGLALTAGDFQMI